MKFLTKKISNVKALISLSVILVFLKIVLAQNGGIIFVFLFDLVLISFFWFLASYFFDVLKRKKLQPITLIINVAVIGAVLLFLAAISFTLFDSIFVSIKDVLREGNVFVIILSSFYSIIVLLALTYLMAVFAYLFFLRQKKNLQIYFITMIAFMILAAFSKVFYEESELQFLKYTFMTVAILLIFVNSLRISWIAFLAKKQKLILLFISIGLAVLYAVNLSQFEDKETIGRILLIFSPSLSQGASLVFTYCLIYFIILFFTALFHLPTAEAFDRKAQEVASLQDLSKLLTQVFDFTELAETVTDTTIKVCKSDASWLSIYEDKEKKFTPVSVKNIKHNEASMLTSEITKLILKNSLPKNGSLILKEVDLFNAEKNLIQSFPTVAYAPLKIQDEINGYLFAAKSNLIEFDSDDENAIKSFAEYSAIAIENSRLVIESIEKERLEKEFDVAREVQNRILPRITPQFSDLDISSLFIPAFEVGGDYFDFFEVNADKLGVVIADVSGKGISAAFYMAEVKGIFESLSKLLMSPREILIKANSILRKSLDSRNFVSAAYCLIEHSTKKVKIARGGHCPILLLRNGDVQYLKPNGMGLGLDGTENFSNNLSEIEINLKENDILALFTDGITEAQNEKHEEFGYERFENILKRNTKFNSEEISKRIIEEITVFSQGSQQHDDITLLIIKCIAN